MSGLNISCGEFVADDKSGSAFERVLLDLIGVPEDIKHDILSGFEEQEFVHIEPSCAAALIEPLETYRSQMVAQIGHSDWWAETQREEANGSDPVKLKWGEGRGWRLYCSVNLLAACRASVQGGEPVAVCLG